MGVPAQGQSPTPPTIRAQCAARAGCAPVYESSPLSGLAHRQNAYSKAVRLAQAHAVETGHAVDVIDGRDVKIVTCRCADCGKPTPGSATGICDPCLFKRVA